MNSYLRKWGVATTINFELFAIDGIDLYITAADGGTDCNIRKDQAADATCTNDFVDEGLGYSLALTATEMEAAEVTIYVIDSATKVYLDTAMKIETYGNASAQHAMDFDDIVRGGLTALPNVVAEGAGGLIVSTLGTTDADDLATAAALTTAQNDLDTISDGIITGTAATSFSTTSCGSSLAGYTADQLVGRVITFLAGPADGESTGITAYAVTNGVITYDTLQVAPQTGNAFKIT